MAAGRSRERCKQKSFHACVFTNHGKNSNLPTLRLSLTCRKIKCLYNEVIYCVTEIQALLNFKRLQTKGGFTFPMMVNTESIIFQSGRNLKI